MFIIIKQKQLNNFTNNEINQIGYRIKRSDIDLLSVMLNVNVHTTSNIISGLVGYK